MVTLQVYLDLGKISANKLTIEEYLTLVWLKFKEDKEEEQLFFNCFKPSTEYFIRLVHKGFILSSIFHNTGYKFLPKAQTLFPSDESLFEQFYSLFPHKVPDDSGNYRPVSTISSNTASAAETKKLWKRIVRQNQSLKEDIIRGLKIELQHRQVSGTMKYLNNIDTWLRNNSWEKWLSLKSSDKTSKRNVRKL